MHLSSLKPSAVYDTYWRFAHERQEIFYRRQEFIAGPWTEDTILRKHKFTNAYRASDRVSQYLIKNVLYRGSQEPRELFFRTLLFKFFNKIATWETLEKELGEVSWSRYIYEQYASILDDAMSRGSIYSAAYIMPTATGFAGAKKHHTHLRLLEHMIVDGIVERLQSRSTAAPAAFSMLHAYPMMGDFLAFQLLIDLNYSALLNFDEMSFVVPGPGARDGLRKCFGTFSGYSEAYVIRAVAERQEEEFDRLGLRFRSLWGRPLQLIDCQNLFCEVDKYARVAHPEIAGITGRTQIKQVFRPLSSPIELFYPPKWGLNDKIGAES